MLTTQHGRELALSLSASNSPAPAHRFPRTLIPASLSLPAARVHQQLPVPTHKRSLASDSVHRLLSWRHLWKQFRCGYNSSCQLPALPEVRFNHPQIQLPKIEEPTFRAPFACLRCAEPGRHYSRLKPTCEKEIIVRQVQIATVPTRTWKQSPARSKPRPCHFQILQ